MVLKGSVHGWLLQEGSDMQHHDMAEEPGGRVNRERKRAGDKVNPSGHIPLAFFFQLDLLLISTYYCVLISRLIH